MSLVPWVISGQVSLRMDLGLQKSVRRTALVGNLDICFLFRAQLLGSGVRPTTVLLEDGDGETSGRALKAPAGYLAPVRPPKPSQSTEKQLETACPGNLTNSFGPRAWG